LSRLVGYREDPGKIEGQQLLWQVAADILPRANVSAFNQALMELGSLLCTPDEPRCGQCPLAVICVARAIGLQDAIPPPKRRQKHTELHEAAIVVRHRERVLLRQCAHGERWAGLWDFPRFAIEASGPLFARDEIVVKVREQTGVICSPVHLLTTMKHGVTRYRITLDCYRADYLSGRVTAHRKVPVRWVELSHLSDYPLSVTGRKLAREIADV
jgi:A/G-specific adenine glycosylase